MIYFRPGLFFFFHSHPQVVYYIWVKFYQHRFIHLGRVAIMKIGADGRNNTSYCELFCRYRCVYELT